MAPGESLAESSSNSSSFQGKKRNGIGAAKAWLRQLSGKPAAATSQTPGASAKRPEGGSTQSSSGPTAKLAHKSVGIDSSKLERQIALAQTDSTSTLSRVSSVMRQVIKGPFKPTAARRKPSQIQVEDDDKSTIAPSSGPPSLLSTPCSEFASPKKSLGPSVALNFWESGDAYSSWEVALDGRQASELSREELQPLVELGMPLKHRLDLWPRWFMPVATVDPEDLDPAWVESIELDIPRTAPQNLDASGEDSLRRLLHGFAHRHPDVGYCQGLNYVAATFLFLGFDEATALHGFCSLIEQCCPGYHGQQLEGYHRDVLVLTALADQVLSAKARRRLSNLGVPLAALALDHFITLASANWPLSATARMWDLILLHGQPAVFASFLALLELYLPEEEDACCVNDSEEYSSPGMAFKQATIRGVTDELPVVLELTRDFLRAVTQEAINHHRFAFSGVRFES